MYLTTLDADEIRKKLVAYMDSHYHSQLWYSHQISIAHPTLLSFLKKKHNPSRTLLMKINKFLKSRQEIGDE